jgi:hypothetical protein
MDTDMKKEKKYNDYTLDEKIIYAKGWNAAIKEAAKLAETSKGYPTTVSQNILKLDKSIQACDD